MQFSKFKTPFGFILCAAAAALTFTATPQKASAQAFDSLLGETRLVGFNFCPRGWAKAEGQLLPIAQNSALFSLYGTMYGGDGRTSFGLPDLRGRAPISNGHSPGLSSYKQGARVGTESFTITVAELPAHNHMMNGTNAAADKHGLGTDFLAAPYNADGTELNIYHEGPPNKQMDRNVISNTGGGQPVIHRGPALPMQWCVSTQGTFPSRN